MEQLVGLAEDQAWMSGQNDGLVLEKINMLSQWL